MVNFFIRISFLLLLLPISTSVHSLDETRPTFVSQAIVDGTNVSIQPTIRRYDVSMWRKNEPQGMTSGSFSNRNFLAKDENGWWSGGDLMPLVKTTDPLSQSGQGARILYRKGYTGGGAPTSTGYNKFSAKSVYVTFTFLVSANWQNHVTGTNKIMFITASGFGGGGDPMFLAYDSDFSPAEITINHQGAGVRIHNMHPNINSVSVPHGEPVLIELYLVMNDAGQANGQAHMWVNNTRTYEMYDIEWVNAGYKWDSIRWEPTWGGSGGVVSENLMYQEVGRMYISYK